VYTARTQADGVDPNCLDRALIAASKAFWDEQKRPGK
jgi:hypothetical protein